MKTSQKKIKPSHPATGRAPVLKNSLHVQLLLAGLPSTTAVAHISPEDLDTLGTKLKV